MIIQYKIKPKSHEEYCDVIDAIGDFLDRNNIEHHKSEILDEGEQDNLSKKILKMRKRF